MAGEATDSAQLLYARHASVDFNARMQGWLTSLSGEVRQAMGENLIALVLGGGYGRGEGGVLRAPRSPSFARIDRLKPVPPRSGRTTISTWC